MDGTTNIIELKGIGEKSATAFGRLGIRDVDSLITMYPKYYLTYEDPKDVNEIEIGQRVSILFVSIRKFIFSMQKNEDCYMHSERSYRNDHACLVQYAIFKETITSGKRLYIYGNSDL